MASTVYVDFSTQTPVLAAWLNDVNNVVYGIGSTAGQVLVSNGVGNVASYTANPTLGALSVTTLTASGFIIPTSTVGIKGTTTNDSPAAGAYGEILTNTTSGTSLATNVANNASFVDVPGGDWFVWGSVQYVPAGTTTVSALSWGTGIVSATFNGLGSANSLILPFTTGNAQTMNIPPVRIKNAGPGNLRIYLVAVATFGVSTMTCNGIISATRAR